MSVSAKLYCKKSRIKEGTAPVYILLRINSKNKFISTRKYVNSNNFDSNSGKATRGEVNIMKLNASLGAKLALIEKVFLDYAHKGRAVNHKGIIKSSNSDEMYANRNWKIQEKPSQKSITLQLNPIFLIELSTYQF